MIAKTRPGTPHRLQKTHYAKNPREHGNRALFPSPVSDETIALNEPAVW
jgi:hypothetical protein